ncbi:transcription antitermination protein NusB [Mariniplasma anaerobium]|uniref:N utilization substance protein B n=1 Tax=Mariniplasma anaerobium TaxID=2735436 RepID=A0A7U9XVA9_9MOLU|nr:transcription antitermination factor NusB [Mariniplasma anaerobium]BCR36226.1 N utilization substance protein B [Mariniplasma anaerobium]
MLNEENRAIRVELMQVMYQFDLYQSEKIAFIPNFEHDQAEVMFHELVEMLTKIDQTIETNLYNYSLYRLSYLDRAIIRIATYELLARDIPVNIVIDEAIELTKIYSNLDDQKQHKFNNKVIDQIAKAIKG